MLTRDFLLEVGCEELPAIPLYKATSQLGQLLVSKLDEAGLAHGEARTMSTPRRIAVLVSDVAAETESASLTFRGPAAAIAFDDEGRPTKAAVGFARGKGADASDLVVREDGGRDYVFLDVEKPAVAAEGILADACLYAIQGVSWPRSQRWGSHHERFGRPVRWIVSLIGDEVVSFSFAGVEAGRTTRGLRVLHAEPEVADAASYEDVLEGAGVIADAERRRRMVTDGIRAIERERGLSADTPKKVFDEVVNLVEFPRVLVGSFDEEFLAVPHEIICESMLSNQRYFPLYDASGALTRNFVVVANSPLDVDETVVDGNERVVRARLYDAKFFYDEDLKVPLEDFRARLASVGFQEKLGSVLQKVERIEALVPVVAQGCGISGEALDDARRAARFCKADLVSSAVVEFTSQQGVMGGYYAEAAGESEGCALAIRDHYRPRFAGDELPRNVAGCMVAVSDKADTIAGIFAIGEPPTGSSDPYALRRAAIGIVNIARQELPQDLEPVFRAALEAYRDQGIDFELEAVLSSVLEFVQGRMVAMAREQGADPDVVAAVVGAGILAPDVFFARVKALGEARTSDAETFQNLGTAFARASHIADASLGCDVDASLLGDVELELLEATDRASREVEDALENQDYARVFGALASLRAPVDRFFEEILVMDEDTGLRENRLRLLNRFERVFAGVADMGALARKK